MCAHFNSFRGFFFVFVDFLLAAGHVRPGIKISTYLAVGETGKLCPGKFRRFLERARTSARVVSCERWAVGGGGGGGGAAAKGNERGPRRFHTLEQCVR